MCYASFLCFNLLTTGAQWSDLFSTSSVHSEVKGQSWEVSWSQMGAGCPSPSVPLTSKWTALVIPSCRVKSAGSLFRDHCWTMLAGGFLVNAECFWVCVCVCLCLCVCVCVCVCVCIDFCRYFWAVLEFTLLSWHSV